MVDEETQIDKTELKEEGADVCLFDPSKKKKKKKVVILDQPEEEPVEAIVEKTESLTVSDAPEASLAGTKKKKKKQVHTDLKDLNEENETPGEEVDDAIGDDEEGDGIVLQQYPWEGSDRDYEY